jgi:hypothetical protein
MKHTVAVLMLLLLNASADLPAQETLPVAPGDRVRASASWPDQFIGSLVAVDDDTLKLDHRAIPLADLERLEVSRGHKYNWSKVGKGTLYGTLGGAAAGTVLGFAAGCDDESGLNRGGCAALTGAFGAAVGAVGGLLVGTVAALVTTERWEEVPLEQLRMGISFDARKRSTFQLSYTFPLGEP